MSGIELKEHVERSATLRLGEITIIASESRFRSCWYAIAIRGELTIASVDGRDADDAIAAALAELGRLHVAIETAVRTAARTPTSALPSFDGEEMMPTEGDT